MLSTPCLIPRACIFYLTHGSTFDTFLFKRFSKSKIQVTSNSWNTKYSQNVTCVRKIILSVKHILLEYPITTELLQKHGYDLNACNSVMDILHDTDVINNIVKLIV